MHGAEDKDTINMLAPVDNIFGTHEGRLAPWLKFLGVSAAPFLVYVFYLQLLVPFKIMLVIELLWTARMALFILGNEPEKRRRYRNASKDMYQDAYSLNNISHRYENKLIEYQNGTVALFLVGFPASYNDDDVFSADLESFLAQLSEFEYDVYLQLFVNEFSLQQNSEKLKVYSNKEFMTQRMEMYQAQDEFANSHSNLYRYVFVIKTRQYNWKTLLDTVNALIESNAAKVFYSLEIADRDLSSELSSRDLGTQLSIDEMLRKKYVNDDYDGSRVLWYGDEVPKKYRVKEEVNDTNKRRIMYLDEVPEE